MYFLRTVKKKQYPVPFTSDFNYDSHDVKSLGAKPSAFRNSVYFFIEDEMVAKKLATIWSRHGEGYHIFRMAPDRLTGLHVFDPDEMVPVYLCLSGVCYNVAQDSTFDDYAHNQS